LRPLIQIDCDPCEPDLSSGVHENSHGVYVAVRSIPFRKLPGTVRAGLVPALTDQRHRLGPSGDRKFRIECCQRVGIIHLRPSSGFIPYRDSPQTALKIEGIAINLSTTTSQVRSS
jgi:hypothetical protein